ncbi:MAG: hypothetical protein WD226_05310 [Planctomycetota bacterium]
MIPALVALIALASPQVEAGALEEERWVRAAALETFQRGVPARVLERLEDERWTARAAALEALHRAARLGVEVPRAAAALQRDEHPNVRALALELAALDGDSPLTEPGRVRDWPSERAAFARAAWRPEVPLERLLTLVGDEDERVRGAALGALTRRPPERESVARALALHPRAAGRALRLAARPADASPPAPVLVAAIQAARGGEVSEVERFVRGFGEVPDRLTPILWAAAEAQPPGLAGALFEALLAGEGPLERWGAAWARAETSDRRLARLAETAPAVLFRGDLDWVEAQFAGLLATRFPGSLAAWWEPGVPAGARDALVDALARGFALDPSANARALLTLALSTPEHEAVAFRALAARPEGSLDDLYAVWRKLPSGEQLVRLTWFADGVVLTNFRAALERLGDQPDLGRSFVVEPLAAFADDAARARLTTWLERDLARFARTDPDPAVRSRPAVESRLLATARALSRLSPGDERFTRALELAATRSDPLARELAHLVDRTALAPFLEDDWRTRARIEAAIVLSDTERGAAVLRQLHAKLAPDLAVRTVAALGRRDDDATRAFLEAVARNDAAPAEVRRGAIDALAQLFDVGALGRIVDAVAAVDVARLALDRLGSSGSEALGVLNALEDTAGARADLGADWSAARAGCAPLEARHYARLFSGPRAAFPSDLARLQDGRSVASVEFSWRSELAALEACAARRTLGRALSLIDGWWEVDGSFLAALGARSREPAVVRDVLAAASIALDGEGGRTRLAGRLRIALALDATKRQEFDRARRLLGALRADLASGRVPLEALSDAFGGADADLGRDPVASFRLLADAAD